MYMFQTFIQENGSKILIDEYTAALVKLLRYNKMINLIKNVECSIFKSIQIPIKKRYEFKHY